MLLAKSCHDIDIMLWMMRETDPVAVSSFGSDFQFGTERKPSEAGEHCMSDCPYVDECIFSAKANYLAASRWEQYVWKSLEWADELTDEMKENSLRNDNPYGKCVWNFERDGNVDHQTVIVNFSNGATGAFSMIGGSAKSERNIHIVGTRGEIKGTFEDSRYVVRTMAPSTESGYTETVYSLDETGDKIGAMGGHGGGDKMLVLDFIDYLNGHEPSVSCATLEDSVISHRTVFKAEEARKNEAIVKISV
jgi:predicted dehydrogenase